MNYFDSIEEMSRQEGLRIETIDFHPELDLMLVVLNTKAILRQKISSYPILKSADKTDLMQYELFANGTGVHWSSLDEDLSLKGFLLDELKNVVQAKPLAD